MAAQQFDCESILHGITLWAGDDLVTSCYLKYSEPSERKQIANSRKILRDEIAPYWSDFIAGVIDEMEAVYLTERQFADVRDQIKGRIFRGQS
ncbi:hypothetical protein DICVIV_06207 [Dictyocaulus viviparus]|uniref:Uncharacterized protein n=1 Tax=Dictyocaulus viviparus TaxID=29172 RepID=A0A0D8XSV0_DICVI|nr:hypothetical protein DICVIV_06207 [Dictyocaulus viviparus]